MADSRLLRCPHCGGEAICDPWPIGTVTYYKVLCRQVISCCASGGAMPTEAEAIAVWNRRPLAATGTPGADRQGIAIPAIQQAIDALETAQAGLQWYRDRCPDAVDGSDDEADDEILAALDSLRELAAPLAGQDLRGSSDGSIEGGEQK